MCESYCLPVLMYAVKSLNLCTSAVRKFDVYWNSVYRKIFSYKPCESVREVMKCLAKNNFEFMYSERKLCFLHNMTVCNNSIISCMMPMYMQSNEYIQLCERCDNLSVHNRPMRPLRL